MAALSAGHLFTDVSQGAVAALVPFLVAERGLSLAAAGSLVLAATVSSSIVQPLFGYFSDRKSLPALMPLGVMFGGLGISLSADRLTPAGSHPRPYMSQVQDKTAKGS